MKDIETVGQELITLFESDLGSAFDIVDSDKGDSIALDDIAKYNYGADDVAGNYPLLCVISLRETQVTEQSYTYSYSVELYLTGDDSTDLEKRCNRSARAIKSVLKTNYSGVGEVPSIEYPPVFSRNNVLFKGVAVLFNILVATD